MRRSTLAATLAFALALPSVVEAQDPPPAQPGPQPDDDNLVAVLEEEGEFQTLLQALQASGLTDALSIDGPFTVFAPTDEAWDDLPPGEMEALLQDPEGLQVLLAYHIVPGEMTSAELRGMEMAESAFGLPLQIDATNGEVRVEDARVTDPDVDAANGVIHVVDEVLDPPQG